MLRKKDERLKRKKVKRKLKDLKEKGGATRKENEKWKKKGNSRGRIVSKKERKKERKKD